MGNFIRQLEASLQKGFVNKETKQSGSYKPELLVNSSRENKTVLSSIQDELRHCEEFLFSVAFITESGLAALKSLFYDLHKRGVTGRIITSTYLYFNQPKVFRELLNIPNVQVRLTEKEGFHSKGYIFRQGDQYSLIVGSSNLTAHALQVNYEWNVKLTTHRDGEIIHHFKDQFEEVWTDANMLTHEWISHYEVLYHQNAERERAVQVREHPSAYQTNAIEEALEITPNKMQRAALANIQAVRDNGENKGLVISATGTGKTYLSAFDVRKFAPKRMLFIVHREQILKKAMQDFKRVLGGIDEDFGLYVGANRQTDKKYVFASIQTLSKPENLKDFEPSDFDYILIDEVHKAGAASYLRVIDFFTPKFLMGMTATPERTDDFNIYELFDYNIAYEIRLQEALEEDMLCPFHYFGVSDFEWDGELVGDHTLLSKLVTNERVDHIIDKLTYYSHAGEKVRGLMFCSRKEEAHELSKEMNIRGYRTAALTGDDSYVERMRRVSQLEDGELDYILTVDIFNEGIDIPSINQVVMLRQTQSSIIFIQQLGRGLRKDQDKPFVTVIDFIGNYTNNYLIPIALSGDRSMNKDNVRRSMKDTSYIKGVSTINFEEVAQKRIFSAINSSNLTSLKILRDAYQNLKNKVGRVPYLYDFIEQNSIDPVVIIDKHNSYFNFLQRMKEEDIPLISPYENQVLTMFSMELVNGKRIHEVVLAELLIAKGSVHLDEFVSELETAGCQVDPDTIESVMRVYDLSFFTQNAQKKYGGQAIITLDQHQVFTFNEKIQQSVNSNSYALFLLTDVLRSAKEKSKAYDCSSKLTLHAKYSRKDVCKLLNWKADESSTMYGYKTKHGTCPVFVTYHKHGEVEASVDYGDEFISPEVFKWYTRSNRTLRSNEVQTIIQSKEKDIDIHLFVKKDDDEGTDFYYLGKGIPDQQSVAEDCMSDDKGKRLPVVHMNMIMEHPVETKLYDYLIEA
ncbi:NgoFVII family restriction endonuclease [Sporosarcina sp. P37]|uniref:DUF3427 domain-containing protein n=1 Tax=unclassified Sporosarcina TaxID=2647733 RepID=UPI000A17C846|nr:MULTISPECIES: DEAD/DEAH box helicase [unclassified Sporosarcina]ARK24835.1 NgoFVII family restriction endonuclease [Sporosarcina sp. P37]PID19995.1 DUF3427 domain-containing protein [Sporosarcina sp. P35]